MVFRKNILSSIKFTLGFTLIEVIIAITLIGVISAWIFPNFINSFRRGRDGRRRADLKSVENSLQAYYSDQQAYPTGSLEWGSRFELDNEYMEELPIDPKNGFSYHYEYLDDDRYILEACLEAPGPDDTEPCKYISDCASSMCYHPGRSTTATPTP